jgi:8-oxo-dGTP pyrophosphatase MutT (NUDIX family)
MQTKRVDFNANAKRFLMDRGITGFDQIKLPGGTSADGSHYCGGVPYTEDAKDIKILVVPYNSDAHKTEVKQNKPMNENPYGTMYRELHEETGLSITVEPIEIDKAYANLPPKPDSLTNHEKHFFLIDRKNGCKGDLLTEAINPFDPETGRPFEITLEEANKVLFFGHRTAVEEGMSLLKLKSIELYNKIEGKFSKLGN